MRMQVRGVKSIEQEVQIAEAKALLGTAYAAMGASGVAAAEYSAAMVVLAVHLPPEHATLVNLQCCMKSLMAQQRILARQATTA